MIELIIFSYLASWFFFNWIIDGTATESWRVEALFVTAPFALLITIIIFLIHDIGRRTHFATGKLYRYLERLGS